MEQRLSAPSWMKGDRPMWNKSSSSLRFDPIPALMQEADPALQYFVCRDLLGETVPPVVQLWELPEPVKISKRQQSDGSWRHPGSAQRNHGPNTSLLETYRNLQVLVEKYGFNRDHPTIQSAARYIFRCQTKKGDIRGIIENQYMPYYHGAILALLIKSGYADDPHVVHGLEWLLVMRQHDGGWIVPAVIKPPKERTPEFWAGEPLPPDRTKPHAHLATGMALRAFAAHPVYAQRAEAFQAACCLRDRILKPDAYNDRENASYWLKFQYPFLWTNLVSALDTLQRFSFPTSDEQIQLAINWFIEHQQPDGLWPTRYDAGRNSKPNRLWVGLAICRILKHNFG